MVGCEAVGCKSRSERGVRMCSFPVDHKRRRRWLVNMRRESMHLPEDSRGLHNRKLCQAHFEEDQFTTTRNGKKRLRGDAIPTLFAHRAPIKRRKRPALRSPTVTAPDSKWIIREHGYSKGHIVSHDAFLDSAALLPPGGLLPPCPPIFTMEDNNYCTDTKSGYVLLLPVCKEEVSSELQECSPILVQVKSEALQIKDEQEEVLLQTPEDADGSSLTLHGVIYGTAYVLHVENAEFLQLTVCKEEVSLEDREGNSSQEEPELPQIKEEQEEEAIGLTLLAVKHEDNDENRETEPLASTSTEHMVSQPTIDDQLLSSHSSETAIEDGDGNLEETMESLSAKSHRKRVKDCGTSQAASDNQLLSCSRSSNSDTGEGLSNLSTRSHTGTKTRFNCTSCHKCFDNMLGLKRHMRRTHADEKSIYCTDCDRIFRSEGAVRRHMHFHCRGGRSVLNTETSHTKPAEGQTSLSEKLFKELTKPPLQCADCDRQFKTKVGLRQHTLQTHINPNHNPYAYNYNYLSID